MSVTDLPAEAAAAARRQALQKGQQTKAAIVDAALGLATQIGLEGLSIGASGRGDQMSKSGVSRPLRLARGTADLRGSASTTSASRKKCSTRRRREAARAARACAPCSPTG
jgi:hypothetical protein